MRRYHRCVPIVGTMGLFLSTVIAVTCISACSDNSSSSSWNDRDAQPDGTVWDPETGSWVPDNDAASGPGGSQQGSGGSGNTSGSAPYEAGVPEGATTLEDGSIPEGSVWTDGSTKPDAETPLIMNCEILVVGGSLGAVAAAHEASSQGRHTCMVAPDGWVGGQLTTQGTPPDEMYYTFSRTYTELRDRVRQYYLNNYNVKPSAKTNVTENGSGVFNPGSCWVSRLCHEPKIALNVIKDMLHPLISNGKLEVIPYLRPTGALKSGNAVTGIGFTPTNPAAKPLIVMAKQTIDATELGDVLPLTEADYVVGGESKAQTGEPEAPDTAVPQCVQPISYVFVLERRPEGENHVIEKPANYDPANYAIGGKWQGTFFTKPKSSSGAFWTYRRLLAAENFQSGVPYDLAVINWAGEPGQGGGNDFDKNCGSAGGCNVLDKGYDEQQAVLQRAKDHALGFAYWIQTEAPRDGGGKGYPNLLLRKDVFDTHDGLSREPYIREARRLKAVTIVRQQDAKARHKSEGQKQYRSVTHYHDTVGITRYFSFDLHQCAGGPVYHFSGAYPSGNAQIPLGALIPQSVDNLLAGAKNIGVTKITNGIYRLHPGEWHIGQAAGAAAALAIEKGITVRELRNDIKLLRTLQHRLITGRGAPIFWWSDLKRDDYRWLAAQMMGAAGVMLGWDELDFKPDQVVTRAQAAALIQREFGFAQASGCHASFTDVSCGHSYYGSVQALADRGVTVGDGNGFFSPDQPVTRAQMATFMVRAACHPRWDEAACPLANPATPSFNDVPKNNIYYKYIETAKAKGWFQGDGSGRFNPNASMPRGHAAIVMFNHMKTTLGL